MKIRIIQVGNVQSSILDIVIEELNKRFKSKFIKDKKIDIPKESFDEYRGQYNSEIILNRLEEEKKPNEKILAITSNDLFAKDMNFVFGVARDGVSIVSTARLDPEFYTGEKNFELLINRVIKEVIHEIGHMFGLPHCKNPTCVMSFSNSVSYVDDKKDEFCKECSLKMSMEGIQI